MFVRVPIDESCAATASTVALVLTETIVGITESRLDGIINENVTEKTGSGQWDTPNRCSRIVPRRSASHAPRCTSECV